MRSSRIFFAMMLALLMAGCSSASNPAAEWKSPWQTVMVNTPGVTGVDCFMESSDRSYKVKAPGTIMIHRSPWPMTVSCYKGNYMKGVSTVVSSYAPKDGEISMASGDLCETCSYPNTISVAMALDRAALQHEIHIFESDVD